MSGSNVDLSLLACVRMRDEAEAENYVKKNVGKSVIEN